MQKNKKGLMNLYVVFIVGLVLVIMFGFLFSTVIQSTQEVFNEKLTADTWIDADHFNAFYLASTLITNIWTYIAIFAFFGLVYFAYLYSQRRGIRS